MSLFDRLEAIRNKLFQSRTQSVKTNKIYSVLLQG